ncbi:hypothetical protein ACFVSN_19195 [Kitasatospora sp. NPDC057904]|uniref:hypothetical protein n=1 Tax=Kitasatospora sp. NPDC057904 TaxID=3346275 RepID=UPI0036DD37D9
MATFDGSTGLLLHVRPDTGLDPDELTELTARLRTELLDDLDLTDAEPVEEESAPEDAKGLGSLAGVLLVHFVDLDMLRAVVTSVRNWVGRTGHVVELSYGGDTLKVTGVTAKQQETMIDDWLARHAAVP